MLKIVFLFLFAAVLLAASFVLADSPKGMIRVIDGDTLDVGGTRVRLFGIDAPEARQTCPSAQGRPWACGDWVSREVRKRYQGRHAVCAPLDVDRYGRIVARCSVAGQDMGAALVAEGLAFAYRRYAMDYDLLEKQAAVAGLGIWAMQMDNPAAFRQQGQRPPPEAHQATGGCDIKGNISAKGERIYHRPGQVDYDSTRINPAQGERWFCSAAEAEAAGWRPARR